jgi:voltage-gated potassium channel
VIFVLAFAIELYLAPSAIGYVRSHWLVVLSLFIPALRVFRVLNAIRVLRGVRVVRSLQLVRTSSAVRRVINVIDEFFELSRVAYLIIVVMVLAPTGGVLLYYLERSDPDTNIDSLTEGVWYSITNIVTLEAQFVPATWEARVVSVVLRVLGMAVVGYLTAAVAVFLLGKRESPEAPARQDELRALRQEIALLRAAIERRDRGG